LKREKKRNRVGKEGLVEGRGTRSILGKWCSKKRKDDRPLCEHSVRGNGGVLLPHRGFSSPKKRISKFSKKKQQKGGKGRRDHFEEKRNTPKAANREKTLGRGRRHAQLTVQKRDRRKKLFFPTEEGTFSGGKKRETGKRHITLRTPPKKREKKNDIGPRGGDVVLITRGGQTLEPRPRSKVDERNVFGKGERGWPAH